MNNNNNNNSNDNSNNGEKHYNIRIGIATTTTEDEESETPETELLEEEADDVVVAVDCDDVSSLAIINAIEDGATSSSETFNDHLYNDETCLFTSFACAATSSGGLTNNNNNDDDDDDNGNNHRHQPPALFQSTNDDDNGDDGTHGAPCSSSTPDGHHGATRETTTNTHVHNNYHDDSYAEAATAVTAIFWSTIMANADKEQLPPSSMMPFEAKCDSRTTNHHHHHHLHHAGTINHTNNNTTWRERIRSMVLKPRDEGIVIEFQKLMEQEHRLAFKLQDVKERKKANNSNKILITETSPETDNNHNNISRQRRTATISPGGEHVRTMTAAEMAADAADSMSVVSSSTTSSSRSISWPRPGAYFVRYLRRHQSEPMSSLSGNNNMRFHFLPFADVVSTSAAAAVSNFPYAIPILDDEEGVNVVRVQGVEYDQAAALQLIKRRRLRTKLTITCTMVIGMVLSCAATAGVIAAVLRRKPQGARVVLPTPVVRSSRPPSTAPTPYITTFLDEPYLQLFAQAVGNNLVFQNGTSYQKAAKWIIYSDPLQLRVTNEHLIQRYLMTLFYFQTSNNGKSAWRFCNAPVKGEYDTCLIVGQEMPLVPTDDLTPFQYFRWLSGKHECNWMGVSCDEYNVVWGLTLNAQNLIGTLPTILTMLTSLQSINLATNQFKGTIPAAFPRVKNLVQFNLQGNMLTGTLSKLWYQASVLRKLNLGNNKISGSIATQVGLLRNLTELQLHNNKMTGSIPTEIGNLSRLSRLSLSNNSFYGSLPTDLGRLRLLKQFWLNQNEMAGTLPSELGLLTSMTSLRLSHNHITGTIPEEFYNMTSLQLGLELEHMLLNGTLSTNIGLMTNLQAFLLGKNHLHGTIPAQLANLQYLGLASFGLNDFTGPIPIQICRKRLELQADCAPIGQPAQECVCCTSCCNRITGHCSFNKNFDL